MVEKPSYEQLEQRVVELEFQIDELRQNELIIRTLLDIANQASFSSDLQGLYRSIHQALSRIVDTTNFYIALYNEKEDSIEFPYAVDLVDKRYSPLTSISSKATLTGQVIFSGKPLLIDREGITNFQAHAGLEIPQCTISEIWMGVPLKIDDVVLGVMVVQSYERRDMYNKTDVAIMARVADHVAVAIERQRMKDALVKSEERFRMSLDAANEGLWDWNIEKNEVFYSPKYWTMLGLPHHNEMLDIGTWLDLMHPEDAKAAYEANRKSIDGKNESFDVEFRMRTVDGSWKWVRSRGKVIDRDENGRARRMLGTHSDIDKRKKFEEERERLEKQLNQAKKMESVGRLAGGVAHDFNNMLSVIKGHVEMALEEINGDEPVRNDLLQIEQAANHSADLTRQLLAFARKQTVAPRLIDINETIVNLLSILKRLLGERIELLWKPGCDVWPITFDPAQLDQIMTNLCVNARDAMHAAGKIIIETSNVVIDEDYCRFHMGFVPGEFVQITVSDTGDGIDERNIPYIFEPFYTTKETGVGTGLGLATVYGILKQNESFINVYSEQGVGSTFTLYVPRQRDGVKELGDIVVEEVVQQKVNETILLVEDEDAILNMARLMLKKQGYKVLAAGTPLEALNIVKQYEGDIHLLLTDVIMPGMNGRELRERIRESIPDIRDLFMSGYTANVVAEQGVIETDMNFLQKPFSRLDFLSAVRRALG